MAEFPAMPFWTDAYIADTGHLTNEEHGLYLKLLILLWRSPGQRIPNDSDWIERRFRGDTAVIQRLVDEFCNRGKWITQGRLSREFQFIAEKAEKQRERIKSRWGKEKDSYRGNTAVIPPTPTPTPTPTPLHKKGSTRHEDVPDGIPVNEPARARLFREGRMLLVSMGVTERTSGAVIGKWLKERADPDGILAALKYADDNDIIEPIAYVSKVLKERKSNGRGQHRETFDERFDRLISKAREVECAKTTRRTDDNH